MFIVDCGTSERSTYVEIYRIKNTFYMNPNNPEYTYNMFWSYLYGEFVLFLEDDRPFINNIEHNIIHSNFIEESILILRKNNNVKGITFKEDYYGNVITKNIKTHLGVHKLCIVTNPLGNYYYVNGPSVQNVRYLLKVNNFFSEIYMARLFMSLKWYTGFTYKGLKCNNNNSFTALCQGVSIHLGRGYSTKIKRNICKNYMY